ncbi:cytochrome b [Robbsia sp. Bb-Pol-6]|uniref:Cytochrome b n=1 Tax=Robbsia betulipollinis TaxID=2981849 RepID=A0ABT3ZRM8_9BURK|nr:cytochrome b [Robbsia betulipollinis]MCY0389206.1 cytochrome b [Robbsia betulipollinis]
MNPSRRLAVRRYSGPAIALHWLIAVLIVGGFALGWVMTDIPGFTPTKLRYYAWHKWIGVTVLLLAVVRLAWRATHTPPPLPESTGRLNAAAAHGTHHLLYLLMFAVPVSGYLYSSVAGIQVVYLGVLPLPTLLAPHPAWRDTMRTVHVWLDWTLAGFVGLHVLAVIKHQLLDRDRLLARMLPRARPSPHD